VIRCPMFHFVRRAPGSLAIAVMCLAACSSSTSPDHSTPLDGSTSDAPSDALGALSSTVVIGPAGGTVAVAGASVVVPAGALATPTALTVTVATDAPPLPGNVTLIGSVFSFTPHGQPFASPVTLNIPFTPPATGAPVLYGASADDESWAPFTAATAANGVLTTQVMHFSWFAPGLASFTCGGIGAACGQGSPGCCYRQDLAVQCDFEGTQICVTYEWGPCSQATDCWGGALGKAGCVAGLCCASNGYPCAPNLTNCCSGNCSAGGLCQ
jgi:hypothetical protein